MTKLASSEAVFGSSSRGDSDALSDQDMLIVDNEVATLSARQKFLEAKGWSVASYTFIKLDFLSRKGSLFIQHLKDEAKILRDVDEGLSSTLMAFRPKESYQSEIAENSGLAQLVTMWPNTGAGALWAADVLYVFVRNFGILYLAEKKRYVFSYAAVLEGLAEDGVIEFASVSKLLKLRFAKSLHRSHQRISLSAASDIIGAAIETLPDEWFPKQTRPISPREAILRSHVLGPSSPAYHRLRNLERAYIALMAVKPDKRTQRNLSVLGKWIENPRAYASFAAGFEDELLVCMKNLVSEGSVGQSQRIIGR